MFVYYLVILLLSFLIYYYDYLSFASDFSLSGSNRELVKGQFHCSDLFVV